MRIAMYYKLDKDEESLYLYSTMKKSYIYK